MADRHPAAAGMAVSLPVQELMAVAHEYEQGKRLDDAGRLLTHVLKAFPEYAPALHLMAWSRSTRDARPRRWR
jgi:hypothetical protein